MLDEAKISRFRENGFLLGRQVLNNDEVDVLRAELLRVIEMRGSADMPQPILLRNLSGNDNAPVWQVVNIWQASEPFRKLISHPLIVEEIAQLTGASEVRLWHDQIQYKPAQIGGVNMWHQDAPFWPVLQPMTEVTAWVALDDVDVDNGCMSMVPMSHLWSNQIAFLTSLPGYDAMPPEYQEHTINLVPCPVKKGHVHYHHALTWHGSHANTSGRSRRAIALHYMTQDTCYAASGEHVMKPYIKVKDGEKMEGDYFPLVYQRESFA
jgi:phytanoyl-CoA hydroxylase